MPAGDVPLHRGTLGGRTVIERRLFHIEDLQAQGAEFPEGSAIARQRGHRTTLSVPLLREGVAIGNIQLRRNEVRAFSDQQIALLQTFADQAVIAIENVRLFTELQARNRALTEALEQQTATSDILRVISSSPTDVQPVFDAIAENSSRLCGAMFSSVYRFDGKLIHTAANHNYPPAALELNRRLFPAVPSRRLFIARAILERGVVYVPDVLADPEHFAPELVQNAGFRSALAVPMLRSGDPIGAIIVWHADVGPFTQKHIALLQTFADQAVIAIENVRLFKELEEKNRALTEAHAQVTETLEQQTATAEILRVISSSPTDIQPVLDAVAANAARVCGATDALIMRVEGHDMRRVAHCGPIPLTLPEVRSITDGSVAGRAILEGRAIHVHDILDTDIARDYPESMPAYESAGWRTTLSVPLVREGVAIGAITIRRTEVRPFAEKQIKLLETFADQAVIAIENVRLFKELEVRNRDLTEALEQQTATSEILRVISSSPTDVQPVFNTIIASAVHLCGAMYGSAVRFDGQLMHLAAGYNYTPEVDRLLHQVFPMRPSPRMMAGRAILSRDVVQVEDALADPDYAKDVARAGGFRSMLAAPMLRDGHPIGAIVVNRGQPGPFSQTQIALLKTFADQAVIAIENVRLFKELEARNRDLTETLEQQTATGEILRVISSSPTDVQPVFDTIAERAMRLCGAAVANVITFDGELLHLASLANVQPVQADALRQMFPAPLSRSTTAGRAILTAGIVRIEDTFADPEYGFAPASAAGFRSTLAVPMLQEGRAIGAVTAGRFEPGPFSERQVELLKTFTDQAVIAIGNVRLFKELEARNAELRVALEQQTATSEVLQVISQSPASTQPVFEAILSSATRLCEAEMGLLFLSNDDTHQAVALRIPDPAFAALFRDPIRPGPKTGLGRLARERRPVHIADITADAAYREADPIRLASAHTGGIRTWLGVPLLREGELLGAIVLYRKEVRPFTERHIDLLQTFADQAVIAIENVRLFKELEARNRDLTEALEQQTATTEILRVISSSPTDIQPIFDVIVRNAVRLCGALYGLVFRHDAGLLHLVAHHNLTDDQLADYRRVFPRPTSDSPIGRATMTGHVLNIPDVESYADAPPESLALWRRRGVRSLLSVPLCRQTEVVGQIGVSHRAVGAFTDSHVELLQTFAAQAVIAIENVRLFNELQARTAQLTRSVEQLTALGEVSRALSSTLDLETVLQTIVARANQLAGTDACSVSEYDEATEEFHLRATNNLDEEVVAVARRTPIRKGEGVQGRMALTRQPVQIPDIATQHAYGGPLRDVLLRSGTRALLAIPLLREDHLVGSLTVTRKTAGEFPPEVIELLTTFATQSALAIQNARLFREIEDKSRQLEVASRHKSQFLANMSHELRTPLNAILGYTELISDHIYGEVPEKMREVLERVEKSGRHLLGLINDILDLSKIEAGQLTLNLNDYAMQDVVRSVASATESLAREKGLALEVAVPDDLPIGRADERRLMQVLLNLVGNAIKFTETGKVAIRAELAGDAFQVAVADTGPGIAEGDREKIFEEFQQADTAVAKTKGGTGLGLAIARRIIEMHGGRLGLESTVGAGSTFSFTVPVRVEQQVVVAPRRPGS
jgi:GAF domain-containing protein